MSGGVIVLEVTALSANGPLMGSLERQRLDVPQGGVVEFALSTAWPLLDLYKKGGGIIRFSRPTDKVIPAPKYNHQCVSVDDVLYPPGQVQRGQPARHLHGRALELMLSTPALPEDDLTWERYAARLEAEDRNAQAAAELQKAKDALEEARSYPGTQEEIELAQAEAAAKAARERLKKVKAIQVKRTREELEEELQQAQMQIEVFQRTGESKKAEASQERLAKAQDALNERLHDEQGVAARALLEPLLAAFDTAATKLAGCAHPYVEAAQLELAAGNFERIPELARQIKAALTPSSRTGSCS